MDQRFFHGELTPGQLAQALIDEFDRGPLRARAAGEADRLAVQISTRSGVPSGGQTALTVTIETTPDGVRVQLGEQAWLGTAASIGRTTMAALMNPWNLISRLDDIAQDVDNIQLSERVWKIIDQAADGLGASRQLSERLNRLACEYCGTANPVGQAACVACGAPLGSLQPGTCPNCGFVVTRHDSKCPSCGHMLVARRELQ